VFLKFSLITENYLHGSDFSFNYWTVKSIQFDNFNERMKVNNLNKEIDKQANSTRYQRIVIISVV
jgi:hypothetical protein